MQAPRNQCKNPAPLKGKNLRKSMCYLSYLVQIVPTTRGGNRAVEAPKGKEEAVIGKQY